MTTAEKCADLARAAIDALNAHDLDRFSDGHADNSETLTVPTGERAFGPSGARHNMERWFTAFPDLSFEILDLSAGEGFSILELCCRGTHRGPLGMPEGDLPPTGRKVETRVCVVTRYRNDEVVAERDYFDVAGMMQQLGLGAAGERPSIKPESRPSA